MLKYATAWPCTAHWRPQAYGAEAVRLAPSDALAHFHYGSALLSAGQTEAAIRGVRLVRVSALLVPWVPHRLHFFNRRVDADARGAALQRSSELIQWSPVFHNLGVAYTVVGRSKDAVLAFEVGAAPGCCGGVAVMIRPSVVTVQAAAALDPLAVSTQKHAGDALQRAGFPAADAGKYYDGAVRAVYAVLHNVLGPVDDVASTIDTEHVATKTAGEEELTMAILRVTSSAKVARDAA